MRLLRMQVISSGLICMRGSWLLGGASSGALGVRDLLAKVLEAVADGGVEDGVPDAHDDATEDVGIDRARQLDAAAGLRPISSPMRLTDRLVELDGARDL